jgi:hypothetical protein
MASTDSTPSVAYAAARTAPPAELSPFEPLPDPSPAASLARLSQTAAIIETSLLDILQHQTRYSPRALNLGELDPLSHLLYRLTAIQKTLLTNQLLIDRAAHAAGAKDTDRAAKDDHGNGNDNINYEKINYWEEIIAREARQRLEMDKLAINPNAPAADCFNPDATESSPTLSPA